MNRDDIIRMAREAGVHHINMDADYIEGFERFAALVAAAEREECARVCERLPAQQDRDVRDECAAAIRARVEA